MTYERRNPTSIVKPRELPWLALEVTQDAGEPLRSRVMVVSILARKGEELPTPALREFT